VGPTPTFNYGRHTVGANMSADKQTTFVEKLDWRRSGFLLLSAQFVIVLSEVMLNSGLWRITYPLVALGLFSPGAQKIWACILVFRILLLAVGCPTWIEQLLTLHFVAIRAMFVWAMFGRHRLVADNVPAKVLARALLRKASVVRTIRTTSVVILVLGVTVLRVQQPFTMILFAGLFWYIRKLLPRPVPQPPGTRKLGLAEMGLSVASVLVFLLVFELAVRQFVPPAPVVKGSMCMAHPRTWFCNKPNTMSKHITREFTSDYVMSDQGFRDRHYARKDRNTYRILCLGDSFTMGVGVNPDEVYAKVLERLFLESSTTKTIEVVNCGTMGFGIWQSLIIFEEKGLALEPDFVILQIDPGNDVRDALARVGKVMRAWDPSYQSYIRDWRLKRPSRVIHALRGISRGFAFLYDRWQELPPRVSSPRFRWTSAKKLDLAELPPRERQRTWWWEVLLADYYPELEEGWELMEESIRRMARLCERKGIGFLVFSVPLKQEVYRERSLEELHSSGIDPATYDLDKVQRMAEELCKRNAIEYVEVIDRLREHCNGEKAIYYWFDGHLTPLGQRICAEVLFEHLMKTHLRSVVRRPADRT